MDAYSHGAPAHGVPVPKGLAFDLDDLNELFAWAKAHRMRLVVELDHEVEGEEYEEVLGFFEEDSALRRWNIWRSHDHFVLEPMNGPTLRAHLVADLMQELTPLRP